MSDLLRDPMPDTLVAGLEANIEAFALYCRRVPGVEIHQDAGLMWMRSGLANGAHNEVVRTRLAADEADVRIAATLADFASRRLPVIWWVTPSARPADLGQRLAAHDLSYRGKGPGMGADLERLPDETSLPAGLRIEVVGDAEAAATWLRTNYAAYGVVPDAIDPGEFAFEEALGFGAGSPYRRYLGRLDGTPVATAAFFLGSGVAGLYSVATLPDVRGRGVGAAISLAALREARALGYRAAVLMSSPLGRPVYERLGFREICPIESYRWKPE